MASLKKPCGAGDDCETAALLVMELQNAVQATLRKNGAFKADGMLELVADMFGHQVRAYQQSSASARTAWSSSDIKANEEGSCRCSDCGGQCGLHMCLLHYLSCSSS